MGSISDTTRSKIVFKKRAHRPWQPSLLEGVNEESSNVVFAPTKIQDKQFQDNQLEFLQKQLETTLEIKSKELETISHNLNTVDDHRITLGGFLRPKDILMVTEQVSMQKSSSLMSELKEKEQEIHTITQHLKISQAEEFAKRAESARLIEEQARLHAEEKAIFAFRQAQAAAEQIKVQEEHIRLGDEKTQTLEQVKLTLEGIVSDLDDKLKIAHHEIEILGQRTQSDAEQRYKIEQELRALNSKLTEQQQHNHALEEHKRSLTQKLEMENRVRIETETKLFDAMQEITEIEQLFETAKANYELVLTQERASYEHSLATQRDSYELTMATERDSYEHTLTNEKETQGILQQNLTDLQTKVQFLRSDKDALTFLQQQTDEKLSKANLRSAKMAQIIATERNLRIMFETKLKESLLLLEKSELRRKLETEACKIAEEKAKSTFEQAGKAMLQLLHTPPAV